MTSRADIQQALSVLDSFLSDLDEDITLPHIAIAPYSTHLDIEVNWHLPIYAEHEHTQLATEIVTHLNATGPREWTAGNLPFFISTDLSEVAAACTGRVEVEATVFIDEEPINRLRTAGLI